MANRKITECTELTTAPAADDVLVIVDISDTTDAASGTTKKQQWLNAIKWLFGSRFAEDAGASDTYVVTLTPAPAAYVTGEHYRFKANTANTGACTVNFNGLGAKAIKKAAGGITTDLADNDIRAGQWVDLVYDGTNMQMQSLLGNAPAGGSGGIGDVVGPASATDLALTRFDGTTGKLIQDSTVTLDDVGAMTFPEMVAPATPAAGKVALYAKSDGLFYSKDDAGLETVVTGGGGGGGSPGGADGDIQYRVDASTFGGSPLKRIDANTVEQKNTTTAQTFRVYKTTTNNVRFRIGNVSNIWELASESDTSADDVHLRLGATFKYQFTTTAFTPTTAVNLGASGSRWSSLFGADVNITGEYRWNSLTRLTAGVDGFPIIIADAGIASNCGWIFGRNDTNGVRLKRNSTVLETRLGGDSDYTTHVAGGFRGAERAADPSAADLTSGANAKDRIQIYMKNDKFVIAYNDAGTVTFITIPLDGSTTTWTHSTSAP